MRNPLWSDARSAVPGIATRDYFGALDGRPGLQHAISQRLITHCQLFSCDTRPESGRRPPAKYGLHYTDRKPHDLLTLVNVIGASSSYCLLADDARRLIDAAFDFKTKTILQPMFTLAFSQAAQRLVSKLTPCVIAAPIKRATPQPVRF